MPVAHSSKRRAWGGGFVFDMPASVRHLTKCVKSLLCLLQQSRAQLSGQAEQLPG